MLESCGMKRSIHVFWTIIAVLMTAIVSRQAAAGLYRADFGTQWDGSRPAWGLKMAGTGLQRFAIEWPDVHD